MILRLVCVALIAFMLPSTNFACSVSRVRAPEELVSGADMIVRAIAVDYQRLPANPDVWTSGVPDSIVSFRVVEVVRGGSLSSLTLHGYLFQRDDFNEHASPYTFVRPGGRRGSCFANFYKSGAEYLLFLKASQVPSEFTVSWAALSPVNEQLHGDQDPSLFWVKKQVKSTENAY